MELYKKYLKELSNIYKSEQFLEHTFRTAFENLLNDFITTNIKRRFRIIQEPPRETFGAPDFKIDNESGNTIGYIECKDITEDIENLTDSEQIKKYLGVSNNLILTNYIDFILFKNGEIVKHCSISSKIDLKSKFAEIRNINEFEDILNQFFLSSPDKIKSTKKLSDELAKRTRILHDFILEKLKNEEEKNPFSKFYKIFKNTVIHDLNIETFADMYAQIISFGLLFFRLSKDMIITRENILSNIPHYIPLLRDFFPNTRFEEWDNDILWILDEIFLLLNNVDSTIIKESLSYKDLPILTKRDKNLKDPFLFFYEEFLNIYDKKTKVKRGVFYTPEAVVSFIIRSLDNILKEKLGIKKGFLDNTIKILDFATGTGTFILALIENIRDELKRTNNYGLFNMEVNDFVLENIYGFELLVVPYIICHLRIHEYLESFGFHYSGDAKERAEIYLTNTLDNSAGTFTEFMEDFDEEAKLANKVKNDEEVLVIMGNPPYSVSSSNKTEFIEDLMKSYKEAVRSEKNIQPLSDDYIKFIRFAHWKMEKVKKGVIGIITNNGFLDGVIHRGMREEISKTFDEIYILNLHGNSNIGETCPDGSKDENVFDIRQGVSISFFIKTGKSKNENKGIYYSSLQGLREKKYEFLYGNNTNKVKWKKLNIDSPNFWFKKKEFSNELSYNKGFLLSDIFKEYNVGVVSSRDDFVIDYQMNDLKKRIKDFFDFNISDETIKEKYKLKEKSDWMITNIRDKIKKYTADDVNNFFTNITYRPFDCRHIFYCDDLLERSRSNLMKHMLKNNLALIGMRQFSYNVDTYCYTFITNGIIDNRTFISSKGTTYLFPLYLYTSSDSSIQEKVPNFTGNFKNFLKTQSFNNESPEMIISYIYSILHSPTYSKKYFEFLKSDYPKIPFTDDEKLFDKLSEKGLRLINLHLLKYEFEKSIANFPVTDPDFEVTKVDYNKGKVWFNDTTYFDNVPENVWNYYIGGYQVLDKWLKERKKHNYTLTGDDVKHFMKVCNVLNETIKIQGEIDKLTKDWV